MNDVLEIFKNILSDTNSKDILYIYYQLIPRSSFLLFAKSFKLHCSEIQLFRVCDYLSTCFSYFDYFLIMFPALIFLTHRKTINRLGWKEREYNVVNKFVWGNEMRDCLLMLAIFACKFKPNVKCSNLTFRVEILLNDFVSYQVLQPYFTL